MEKLTITGLAEKVPDEAAAYRLLEEWRWGDRPVCPHCGSARPPYFLTPKNEEGRQTRRGKTTSRRVWKCAETGCRKQFTVTTGTIMHGTHIPIRTWLFVMFEMAANKNGLAAREIERKYGVTPKSAWFMTQRIREAMRREPVAGLLSGTVIADETFIGGKLANKHVSVRAGKDGRNRDNKTAVFSLVHRETGEVRSQVVPNVRAETLRTAIMEHVDPPTSVLHTDSSGPYTRLGWKFIAHESVNHVMSEYVRGEVTTNHVEGYFSQLKRSLDGTYHAVSAAHLPRYLAEFDYRYSTRGLSDTERTMRLIGQMRGRRLSYEPLRGGVQA